MPETRPGILILRAICWLLLWAAYWDVEGAGWAWGKVRGRKE